MTENEWAPYVVLNGVLQPAASASVSVFDRGFLYGDGLFETLPLYGGRPFLLAAHLARLAAGAAALRFPGTLEALPWTAWIDQLVQANALAQGVLRIAVSRGRAGAPGVRCASSGPLTVVLSAAPPRQFPAHFVLTGIVLQQSAHVHPAPAMLPTACKHSNYLVSVLAFDDAVRAGADEALLLNHHGRVCEAAMSNIVAIAAGQLLTPSLSEGPLAGITRQTVLDLAGQVGLEPIETALTVADLAAADECFLTNSLAGLVPVRALMAPDGTAQAQWSATGPLTRRLAAAYWARVRAEAGPPWGLGAQ